MCAGSRKPVVVVATALNTHSDTHTHTQKGKREEERLVLFFSLLYIYFSVEVGQVERALSSTAAVIRRIFFFFFSNNKKKELTIDFLWLRKSRDEAERERDPSRSESALPVHPTLFQVRVPPPPPLAPTDQRLLITK